MASNNKYFYNVKTRYDAKGKPANIESYVKYMLARSQAMFSYEGLPETIPQEMLELLLQTNGFAGIAQHEGNLYAFYGGLGGFPDPYYRPTQFIVANPALKLSKSYKIYTDDADAVIIKNDTMLQGLLPIYKKYGTLLIENELSINIVDIVTRCMFIMTAGTDSAKKAAQKYIEDVFNGELGVIWDPAALETVKVNPTATSMQSNAIKTLIELEQYLKAASFNDIGISASFNMKREYVNEAESAANDDALLPFIDNMLECRERGLEEVNKMFGTNITVELNSAWEDQELLNEEVAGDPKEPGAREDGNDDIN